MDADSIREFALWLRAGSLTAFGGLVGYLIEVQAGRPFSWFAYMTFILSAFLVGQVLDGALSPTMPGRGGLLLVAGTIAYPLLAVFQDYLVTLACKITGRAPSEVLHYGFRGRLAGRAPDRPPDPPAPAEED